MTDLWLSGVFFQALNTPKRVFGRGSTPDPAGGAYDPLVGWGGDTSIGCQAPQHKFLATPMSK